MSRARSRIRTTSGTEIYCEESYEDLRDKWNDARARDGLVECEDAYERGAGRRSFRARDIESIDEWKEEEERRDD